MSRRDEYSTETGQKGKEETMVVARKKPNIVKKMAEDTGLFKSVSHYQPTDEKLLLNGSPAVLVTLQNGGKKLVIAPDLKCIAQDDTVLWIEVKDKPQRDKYPDTGCDIHQYVGYWAINKYNHEPVLFMTIDDKLTEDRLNRYNLPKQEEMKKRWKMFAPDGEPNFYGNWIKVLAEYDSGKKYPACSLDRSRTTPINIAYFDIYKMVPIPDSNALRTFLKYYKDYRNDIPDFKVYYWNTSSEVTDYDSLMPSWAR